jgi:hypothetical protein
MDIKGSLSFDTVADKPSTQVSRPRPYPCKYSCICKIIHSNLMHITWRVFPIQCALFSFISLSLFLYPSLSIVSECVCVCQYNVHPHVHAHICSLLMTQSLCPNCFLDPCPHMHNSYLQTDTHSTYTRAHTHTFHFLLVIHTTCDRVFTPWFPAFLSERNKTWRVILLKHPFQVMAQRKSTSSFSCSDSICISNDFWEFLLVTL